MILERSPCHAYFDLEYSKEANPDVCGDTMVNRLVVLLMGAFRERWGLTLRKQVWVCVWGGGGCWGSGGGGREGGKERRDPTQAQLRSGEVKARVCGDTMVNLLVVLLMGAFQGVVGRDTA